MGEPLEVEVQVVRPAVAVMARVHWGADWYNLRRESRSSWQWYGVVDPYEHEPAGSNPSVPSRK